MRYTKGQGPGARGQGIRAGELQFPGRSYAIWRSEPVTKSPIAHRKYRRHRGFSLMELLVVVAIIILLVGLFTVGTWYVSQSMNARQTRIAMQQAMLALAEYTASTQQHIAFPYDGPATYDRESIEYFTEQILKVPSAREVLLTIDQVGHEDDNPPSRAKLIDTDGSGDAGYGDPNYIRDAWQTPLQYRSWHDGGPAYAGAGDLPARGSATHAQPFFASAGPDKIFGTEDDLFSFEID